MSTDWETIFQIYIENGQFDDHPKRRNSVRPIIIISHQFITISRSGLVEARQNFLQLYVFLYIYFSETNYATALLKWNFEFNIPHRIPTKYRLFDSSPAIQNYAEVGCMVAFIGNAACCIYVS